MNDYLEEGGKILTITGPTKTGKSVLVEMVTPNAAWLRPQGIDSADEMWRRIADELGLFTELSRDIVNTKSEGHERIVKIGPPLVNTEGHKSEQDDRSLADRFKVSRPIGSVVTASLRGRRDRAIVIDDFHFIQRRVQRELVRALKPLVFNDVAVILLSSLIGPTTW